MAKYLLAVLLVFSIAPTVYGQVSLSIDPQFDQSRIDFNLWNNTVVPMHDKLTEPFPRPELRINFLANASQGACGIISFGSYPFDRSDITDGSGVYFALTHEYGHSKSCNPWFSLVAVQEGRVNSEACVTYRQLFNVGQSTKSCSKLWIANTLHNLPLNVAGGGKTFYDNLFGIGNPSVFDMVAADFEMLINKLPGKNFTRLHQEMNQTTGSTYAEYYAMLDKICVGKIDGVLCSTYFQNDPVTFEKGPDGRFFGIYAFRNMDGPWLSTRTVVNPDHVDALIVTRNGGITGRESSSTIYWEARDVNGKVVLSFPKSGISNTSPLDTTKLIEGAYTLFGCQLVNNVCDTELQSTSSFVLYRKSWERGKIIVIANGPKFENWLTLVNPPSGITTEVYPGMLVVNLNGSTDDITITDGNRVRTITPDRELSRIVTFIQRDQPYVYSVTNGASFKAGSVTPGSIATLFTWGATHTDPELSTSLPLPTSSCKGGQGETRVVFVQNGVETKAPFFYCSQRQLNVQVPSQLQTGKAQACVELNSTRSNCLDIDVVEADPGIIVSDWTNKSGAIIQDGRTLSIYATGLGAVNAPPADGTPALNAMSVTTNQPIVILDGAIDCPVSFSGLAPGFVGLYQVNCMLNDSVQAGKHSLVLSTRNADSNIVSVSIQ